MGTWRNGQRAVAASTVMAMSWLWKMAWRDSRSPVVQFWCKSARMCATSAPFAKGGTIMATIVRRTSKNGQLSYRAQVRRKGAPPLSATFTKLSDARKWGQITEAAIFEGRHFKTAEAKRHTLADLIDRYCRDVLPHKSASSIRKQTQQLQWWRARLGHCIL